MSHFSCPVVSVGKVGRHPNADTLSLTQVMGETVIFRTGDFHEGQLAIYVPEDAVVPETVPGTEFLGRHRRIRAKKLRGIFSCGLLLPLFHDNLPIVSMCGKVGDDVSADLGITKWEEPEPVGFGGENERDPGWMPVFDVEPYRKYKHVLALREPVVVTEKLHGTNFRAVWRDGLFFVGSHKTFKRRGSNNVYWRAAHQYDLEARLERFPGVAVYGEVFGAVQDMKYDCKSGEIRLALFAAYDTVARRFLDWDDFQALARRMGVPTVPVLAQGILFDPDEFEATYGKDAGSALASHNREGVVIQPMREQWNPETGRTILKLVSEWYRLRKGGTEAH